LSDRPDSQKLKELICDEITKTQAAISELEEQTKPVELDNAIGRITRMDAITNKGVKETALLNTKARLTKLQQALQRIDDPEFGICEMCSEPIPLKRIMLVPESTICVDCHREVQDTRNPKFT